MIPNSRSSDPPDRGQYVGLFAFPNEYKEGRARGLSPDKRRHGGSLGRKSPWDIINCRHERDKLSARLGAGRGWAIIEGAHSTGAAQKLDHGPNGWSERPVWNDHPGKKGPSWGWVV